MLLGDQLISLLLEGTMNQLFSNTECRSYKVLHQLKKSYMSNNNDHNYLYSAETMTDMAKTTKPKLMLLKDKLS